MCGFHAFKTYLPRNMDTGRIFPPSSIHLINVVGIGRLQEDIVGAGLENKSVSIKLLKRNEIRVGVSEVQDLVKACVK